MVTYQSTEFSLATVGDGRSRAVSAAKSGGKVRCSTFRFVLTTTLENGDIVKLCKIPKGSLLLQALITQVMPFPDINMDINLGTNLNPTALGASLILANLGTFPLGQVLELYQTTDYEDFQMEVVASVNGGTAGRILRGYVLFSSSN